MTSSLQEARAEEAKLNAHAYLKPSVLRDSWRDVLRSVQQNTRSVIVVPRLVASQSHTSPDQPQHADQDGGASGVSVATSDVAAQHGILHTGDVCCPLPLHRHKHQYIFSFRFSLWTVGPNCCSRLVLVPRSMRPKITLWA